MIVGRAQQGAEQLLAAAGLSAENMSRVVDSIMATTGGDTTAAPAAEAPAPPASAPAPPSRRPSPPQRCPAPRRRAPEPESESPGETEEPEPSGEAR